jgi:hypothetical protein
MVLNRKPRSPPADEVEHTTSGEGEWNLEPSGMEMIQVRELL